MEKDDEIERIKLKIIETYEDTPGLSILNAAINAGVNAGKFYRWRREDPEFGQGCKNAVIRKRGNLLGKGLPKGKDNPMVNGTVQKLGLKTRSKKSEALRHKWIEAYKKTNFNIGEACELIGIKRSTYVKWRTNFPSFKDDVEEANEAMKDFIEGRLLKNVGEGDSQCIIFACETKLKDRGYIKKQLLEHSGNFGVMVAPARIEDQNEWAMKATKQQQKLKERSMKTDYIKELKE